MTPGLGTAPRGRSEELKALRRGPLCGLMRFGPLALAALLLLPQLAGCRAIPLELGVPLDEQLIDGDPLGGVLELPFPLDLDVAAETEGMDTGPIRRIRVRNLRFTITATAEAEGDRDDFEFLDGVDVVVEPAREGDLPSQVIARSLPPTEEGRTLPFETERDVDLVPYIEVGTRVRAVARGQLPPDDVSFDGHLTLGLELF